MIPLTCATVRDRCTIRSALRLRLDAASVLVHTGAARATLIPVMPPSCPTTRRRARIESQNVNVRKRGARVSAGRRSSRRESARIRAVSASSASMFVDNARKSGPVPLCGAFGWSEGLGPTRQPCPLSSYITVRASVWQRRPVSRGRRSYCACFVTLRCRVAWRVSEGFDHKAVAVSSPVLRPLISMIYRRKRALGVRYTQDVPHPVVGTVL